MKCAELLGYHYHMVGFCKPWDGWVTKLREYELSLGAALQSGFIQVDDPVFLVDGWDCAVVGPAEEFRDKLQSEEYASKP
eukprot:1386036-Amphidinium_carterae.1